MQYRTNDGALIQGADARETAEALRAVSMTPGRDLSEFMWQTAGRVRTYNGARVRPDTPENFVADLVSAGLLTLED